MATIVTDPTGSAEEQDRFDSTMGADDGDGHSHDTMVDSQPTTTDTAPPVSKSPLNNNPSPVRNGRSKKKVAIDRAGSAPKPVPKNYTRQALDRAGSAPPGASGHIGHRHRHLPSFQSIKLPVTLLPEEDVGVQLHLTDTKEIQTVEVGDGEDEPARTTSRFRKTLTAVGASSLGFRLAEMVLSLIAIVVMCSNSQSVPTRGAVFGFLRFNHFQAYRYLVAVNVCVFVYSTLQFVQLAYTVILGISFIPSILISTWLTFGCDQIFAYLLMSASTSAATVAVMSHNGEMGIHLCSSYGLHSFCARADVAVAMSFFAFFAMLSSTILSIYRIGVLLKDW